MGKLLCVVLLLCMPLAVAAQAPDPRFAADSRLVLVPVNVTDAKGRPVEGLEAADFLVADNGQPQKAGVDTIDTGVAAIALVIAVQSSGISTAVLEKVRKIGAMVQPLVTGERGCAGVVSFAERVSWLEDCTKDPDALERAFQKLRPGEHKEARMLDAVDSAVEHLGRHPNARRVLLLISESRDRGSETDLEAVAVAAQSAGVTVYSATYSAFKTAFTSKTPVSPPGRPEGPKSASETMGTMNGAPPNPWNPKIPPPEHRVDIAGGIGELARLGQTNTTEVLIKRTGGAAFPFTKQRALEEAIRKLGAELHSQYLLSFVPEAVAPGYHSLEVRVTRPGEFRIRARPGYWSKQE